MNRLWIILLGVIIGGFLVVPGNSLARTSHTGVHAVSPFDAPKVKKSLHCMLKGHHHSALPFCPHTIRDRSGQTQFKSDCGDHPLGTQIQTSWSKIVLYFKPLANVSPDIRNFAFESSQFLLSSTIPDPLERPPQYA